MPEVSLLPIDIPTLAASRALMQMALGGLIIYIGSQQQRGLGTRWWAAGLLINGIALLAFTIQAPEWDRLLTVINHIGGGIASACLLLGFWRFSRRHPNRVILALLVLIPVLSLLAWEVAMPNARLRVLTTASGQLLFLLALQHGLGWPPRTEMAVIYRRMRWIVLVYAVIFVWAYGSIAGVLPTTARVGAGYHRTLFSVSSLLFMLALAVTCLALQFALLAAQSADLSVRDWLTGVLNRRGLFEAAPRLVAAAATGDRLAVIALDIDHFKDINDRHGHAIGDRALKAIGDLLTTHAGNDRLVARMGGEEFSIVLRDTTLQAVTDLADRIRRDCAELQVASREGVIRFTVSAGVADGDAHQDIGELLARADAALYAAKEGGRNRVVVAGAAALSGNHL